MNCTLFLSTFACRMSLCTINPAENLAHLLSFQTMNPSLSSARQMYQSLVMRYAARSGKFRPRNCPQASPRG